MLNEAEKLLSRGVEEVIERNHLEAILRGIRLSSAEVQARGKRKLRVKFGIDPTAPDLHLGHTVPLRKLRQFQDAGHQAVLIIGDFTAMIGDPSGREGARPPLTKKEVKANLKKYLKQAGKVINLRKAEVHYNSNWFKKNSELILEIAGKVSVQRLTERDDFQKRIKDGIEVMDAETLYPLLQGYDSVVVKSDLEIGGTDQKFNLLMGRRLQRAYNLPEQDIITLPLLEGIDGVKKMSKSYGNYIALDAEPNDMFGKIMAVPDNLIDKYYSLLTDEDRKIQDPREAKLELGRIIVSMYHGEKAGQKAKEEFIKVFSQKESPSDPQITRVSSEKIIDLLVEVGAAKSKSEAARLIVQGGVKKNGIKIVNGAALVPDGSIIQVGPHRFYKIVRK